MSIGKPALPSIAADLTPAARPRVNLKGLAPRSSLDDAAVDANSQALGARWGLATPAAEQNPVPTMAAPVAPAAVPLASLRLEIPDYLDTELTMKAAQGRVTKSFLVMTALAEAGYRVEPGDLVPDRRKARARKM